MLSLVLGYFVFGCIMGFFAAGIWADWRQLRHQARLAAGERYCDADLDGWFADLSDEERYPWPGGRSKCSKDR